MIPGAPDQELPPDNAGDHSRCPESLLVLLALVAVAFSAYGTAAVRYHFFADDFVYVRDFTDPTASFQWGVEGVWRFLGNTAMTTGLSFAPRLYVALMVLLHAGNAFLAWAILRRLGVGRSSAALLGGLLAAFPGFHEAVVWIPASDNVWSTTFFLLVFLACLRAAARGPTAGMTLLAFAGALIGDLFHDQYSLAYFVLPVAATWLQSGRWLLPLDRRRLAALAAPVLGSGLYILAYLLTLQPTTTKQPAFNWHSLFSPFVYQYANFAAFDVWQHAIWARAFAQRLASPAGVGLLALLAAGTAVIGWESSRAPDRGSRPPPPPPSPAKAAWSALLLSLASVYVVAGGYSLDSRKRYAFVFLGALALGHLRRSQPRLRWVGSAVVAVALCALTTVALTEARNGMLAAMDQIDTAIAAGQVPAGTYIVDWDSGPSRLGPYLWTDPLEQIWNQLPAAGGPPPVVRNPSNARQLTLYDWPRRRWELIPPAGLGK